MRRPLATVVDSFVVVAALAVAAAVAVAAETTGPSVAKVAGFAFVDSSVTGQGSRAVLPEGARVYPPGSTVSGADGCPTEPHGTDGLLVAVIDYEGHPSAGSLTVTREPERGGKFTGAPYFLDLGAGRKLQALGPIFDNGTCTVELTYGVGAGASKTASGALVLRRTCPPTD